MSHRVRYYHPGSFYDETSSKPIERRDVDLAVELAPDSAFAFELYELEDAPPLDLDPERFEIICKPYNRSGKYFIDGAIFTAAQIKGLDGDHEILLDNMRCNGWSLVVRTRRGNWQPLESGDQIVSSIGDPYAHGRRT